MTGKAAAPGADAPTRGQLHGVPLLVLVVALVGRCWLLGEAPLAGTEGHRALTAHEMLETGNWVTPHLYGRPYLIKPPLHYWILAGLEWLTGAADEGLWRLPSALFSSLLAAFICVMTRRWFGGVAGLAAGIAYLALVPLWAEHRTADIDALSNASAVASALCFLELGFGRGRRWKWSLAAGSLLGMTLLLKGHAGLPVVAGAIFGSPLLAIGARALRPRAPLPESCRRAFRSLLSPWLYLSLMIGAALFAGWVALLWNDLESTGTEPDLTGLKLARTFATILDLRELRRSLALPFVLFAYSLPVSLAVLLAFAPGLTGNLSPAARRFRLGLGGCLVVSLVVCVLCGVGSPRYAYVCLPAMAPLVGLVAEAWRCGHLSAGARRLARGLAVLSALTFGLLPAAFVTIVWTDLRSAGTPVAVAVLAFGLGAVTVWKIVRRRDSGVAGACFVLILLSTVAFAYVRNVNRSKRSGQNAAPILAAALGDDRRVTAGYMVWDKPELFHYAGVVTRWRSREHLLPPDLPREGWVVLHPIEWKLWSTERPDRLSRVFRFRVWKTEATLAWYRPPGVPEAEE